MRTSLLIAGLAAACAAAARLAPTREIVTEIVIEAAPERVWSVLANGEAFGDWNPFIISMKGDLVAGAVIENTLQPEPGKRMTFRPRVLVADENRELRWLGRLLLPAIFDGEHYFLLQPHPAGTRLVHGERFSGIGLWLIDPARFKANFAAMNIALKHKAESDPRAERTTAQV